VEVDELPAPVPPNEHAGPATLLIHLPVLVLPFGGGATGHHGGIAVDTSRTTLRSGAYARVPSPLISRWGQMLGTTAPGADGTATPPRSSSSGGARQRAPELC
jgi:hypothetical protein